MKGFKYQITLKSFIKQIKRNGDTGFSIAYFNSTVKAVINTNKYGLNKSFRQFLCRIDNWINEGSDWTIEYIDGEHINISAYSPLSGTMYVELLNKSN